MNCKRTDRQGELATKFFHAAQKRARMLARDLRDRGLPVDPDEIESDATLFLLKAADSYSERFDNRAAGYFKQSLNGWALNREKQLLTVASDPRNPSRLPSNFDRAAPEYTPDFEYDEEEAAAQRSREVVLNQVAELPRVGEDLKRVLTLMLDKGLTFKEVRELVGNHRWYRVLLPALQEFAEFGTGEVIDGEGEVRI